MTGSRPRIRVVSAEVERDGCYLITQRRADAVLPSLWEFPGGRVREGESDETTLQRTLRERVGIHLHVGEMSMQFVHGYEAYDLEMVVYRCTTDDEPEPLRVQDARWVRHGDFGRYTFPGADQHTVDQLISSLD